MKLRQKQTLLVFQISCVVHRNKTKTGNMKKDKDFYVAKIFFSCYFSSKFSPFLVVYAQYSASL